MTMRLRRDWMWAEACEMLERAERLHRRFFEVALAREARPTWEPPVDLFETPSLLWLVVALPGIDPARLDVTIDSESVTIAGERALPAELRSAAIHRLEIPHGRFERRVELPPGRFALARQSFVDGCLALALRRRA
jgi:HSP20 family protein